MFKTGQNPAFDWLLPVPVISARPRTRAQPLAMAGESICATCPLAVSCRVFTTSKPNLRLPTTHNQQTGPQRPPPPTAGH